MKSFLSKHIVRFLDGDLSPEEEKELLESEPVVSQMKKQWDANRGDISNFDSERVFRKVEAKIDGGKIISQKRKVYLWAASVAASILILSTIGYRLLFFEPKTESDNDVMMLAFETQSKERIMLTLPDSTIVWLNAGSRIEYPEIFAQDVRQVTLTGEAYFDVTHQPNQPFYVQTGKLHVHVLGTQFTVSDYPDESSAEATLISGKVNVNVLNDSAKRTFELFPDEQLIVDEDQRSTVIQNVDASKYSGWIHGRLHFDNADLEHIISKLGHWFGVKFECRDEIAVLNRLTFTVRDESIEQIVRLMQTIAPISFIQEGDTYKIVSTQ